MTRREFYNNLFKDADPSERDLIDHLIDEAVFCETKMDELKALPFIRVNPQNPEQQKITPAARLYKDYTASYRDTLRIMLNILRKSESSATDELLRKLEEFE